MDHTSLVSVRSHHELS